MSIRSRTPRVLAVAGAPIREGHMLAQKFVTQMSVAQGLLRGWSMRPSAASLYRAKVEGASKSSECHQCFKSTQQTLSELRVFGRYENKSDPERQE